MTAILISYFIKSGPSVFYNHVPPNDFSVFGAHGARGEMECNFCFYMSFPPLVFFGVFCKEVWGSY